MVYHLNKKEKKRKSLHFILLQMYGVNPFFSNFIHFCHNYQRGQRKMASIKLSAPVETNRNTN